MIIHNKLNIKLISHTSVNMHPVLVPPICQAPVTSCLPLKSREKPQVLICFSLDSFGIGLFNKMGNVIFRN